MKITKTYAKEILNLHKDNTAYFNELMTREEFENMLLYRFNFGLSEATVITMALILAGAKFKAN